MTNKEDVRGLIGLATTAARQGRREPAPEAIGQLLSMVGALRRLPAIAEHVARMSATEDGRPCAEWPRRVHALEVGLRGEADAIERTVRQLAEALGIAC